MIAASRLVDPRVADEDKANPGTAVRVHAARLGEGLADIRGGWVVDAIYEDARGGE